MKLIHHILLLSTTARFTDWAEVDFSPFHVRSDGCQWINKAYAKSVGGHSIGTGQIGMSREIARFLERNEA